MKFKVGDKVRCIENGRHGAGWGLGNEFIIEKITENDDQPIYWKEGKGVFEDSLELVAESLSTRTTEKIVKKKKKISTRKGYFIYGETELKIINSQHHLVPLTTNHIILPEEDQKALGIALKKNLACLLIGETGCLHPNTPIYDPISKKTETVLKRWQKGKSFNVYALNKKKEIIITKAETPKKYFKTKMYKVFFSNGESIIVTGKHRFFDGKSYISVLDFLQSQKLKEFLSLFPTISAFSLLKLSADVQNWKKTNADFQADCQLLSYLYDQQPLLEKDNGLNVVPLLAYATNKPYDGYNGDDLAYKYKNSHLSALSHSSNGDFSFPKNKNQQAGLEFFSLLNIFLMFPVFHRFYGLLDALINQIDIALLRLKSFFQTNALPFFNGKTGTAICQIEKIEEYGEEIYYDFHVPKYENYYACGIFHHNTGKTSAVKELAYLRKQPYVRVNMTGYTTPDELIGSKSVKNGATYYEDGIITNAMKIGAILVLDEINATMPDCMFILHGLLDDDRQITLPNGEVIKPHPNFRVFATCNPDYEGTRSMNKAFIDRFPIILSIDSLNPEKEIKLLKERTGIESDLANQLVTIAQMVRKDYLEQKTTVYLSTRSLLNMAFLIREGLTAEEAYQKTVVMKSQNKPEQKVLQDFFMAVFRLAGNKQSEESFRILTIKEIEVLNKTITDLEAFKKSAVEKDEELSLKTEKCNSLEKELVKVKGKLEIKLAELEKAIEELGSYQKLDELIKKVAQNVKS